MAQRIRNEVLDDPLDLRPVERHRDRRHLDVDRPAIGVLDLGEHARDERREIGGPPLRRHDAALEPVEVQEVAEEPLELPRVPGDPMDEIQRVAVREVELALLERQRRPEDRGQRRSQIVRHGLQERVLHRVQRAELL